MTANTGAKILFISISLLRPPSWHHDGRPRNVQVWPRPNALKDPLNGRRPRFLGGGPAADLSRGLVFSLPVPRCRCRDFLHAPRWSVTHDSLVVRGGMYAEVVALPGFASAAVCTPSGPSDLRLASLMRHNFFPLSQLPNCWPDFPAGRPRSLLLTDENARFPIPDVSAPQHPVWDSTSRIRVNECRISKARPLAGTKIALPQNPWMRSKVTSGFGVRHYGNAYQGK
jgi:hypothetical protein